MNLLNLILNTDSYKGSHFLQMPPGTEYQSSYIESRGGKWDTHLFFGLQMYLKEYLCKPITQEMIDEADAFLTAHGLPFNREGWQYILNKHGGYIPIEIEAIPEGTVLPTKNVLVQAVNTDPKCFWVTSYFETGLLRAVWYPTTVATNSFMIKKVILSFLNKTSDDPDGEIAFKLHDFGARGVSSMESAGLGGVAHLVNFMGSDTLSGALYARKYYGENMAAFSVPASEHSTITSWGGPDKEVDAFNNMLDQFAKPGALVACVSDSYDIHNAASHLWGEVLKDKVVNSGATLVVRPDSGDPTVVPVEVVELLMEKFGHTVNNKGFRILPDCVRVIQGDGVNIDSITQILQNMYNKRLSASNIGFGMGGALLQQLDRDTLQFAMKCSAIKKTNDYEWQDVYKDPKSDPGKASKKGRLALKKLTGLGSIGWKTVRAEKIYQPSENELEVVFRNGELLKSESFANIRIRANRGLLG